MMTEWKPYFNESVVCNKQRDGYGRVEMKAMLIILPTLLKKVKIVRASGKRQGQDLIGNKDDTSKPEQRFKARAKNLCTRQALSKPWDMKI